MRSVFIIGPDKKIKAMLTYPMSTGRNFDEVLRLLDSLQLTAKHTVATPVNWKPGDDVIIPPAVSDDEAKAKYPQGWKTLKPYLRVVGTAAGLSSSLRKILGWPRPARDAGVASSFHLPVSVAAGAGKT